MTECSDSLSEGLVKAAVERVFGPDHEYRVSSIDCQGPVSDMRVAHVHRVTLQVVDKIHFQAHVDLRVPDGFLTAGDVPRGSRWDTVPGGQRQLMEAFVEAVFPWARTFPTTVDGIVTRWSRRIHGVRMASEVSFIGAEGIPMSYWATFWGDEPEPIVKLSRDSALAIATAALPFPSFATEEDRAHFGGSDAEAEAARTRFPPVPHPTVEDLRMEGFQGVLRPCWSFLFHHKKLRVYGWEQGQPKISPSPRGHAWASVDAETGEVLGVGSD